MATDFELQVLEELSEIKSATATTAEKVNGLDIRLFHAQTGVIKTIQDDITEIKANRVDDHKWDRIHNIVHYSIGPLLVLGHQIARKFFGVEL